MIKISDNRIIIETKTVIAEMIDGRLVNLKSRKKPLQNACDYAIIFRAVLDEPTACAKEVRMREREDPSQIWQVHRPLRVR